jgi:hypothetical protein
LANLKEINEDALRAAIEWARVEAHASVERAAHSALEQVTQAAAAVRSELPGLTELAGQADVAFVAENAIGYRGDQERYFQLLIDGQNQLTFGKANAKSGHYRCSALPGGRHSREGRDDQALPDVPAGDGRRGDVDHSGGRQRRGDLVIPVVDARTGETVAIGQTVREPSGHWYKLADVTDWLLRARATVHTPGGVMRVWMPIRFRTNVFGRQRVAIYPS